jgi:hypothetical protein
VHRRYRVGIQASSACALAAWSPHTRANRRGQTWSSASSTTRPMQLCSLTCGHASHLQKSSAIYSTSSCFPISDDTKRKWSDHLSKMRMLTPMQALVRKPAHTRDALISWRVAKTWCEAELGCERQFHQLPILPRQICLCLTSRHVDTPVSTRQSAGENGQAKILRHINYPSNNRLSHSLTYEGGRE